MNGLTTGLIEDSSEPWSLVLSSAHVLDTFGLSGVNPVLSRSSRLFFVVFASQCMTCFHSLPSSIRKTRGIARRGGPVLGPWTPSQPLKSGYALHKTCLQSSFLDYKFQFLRSAVFSLTSLLWTLSFQEMSSIPC